MRIALAALAGLGAFGGIVLAVPQVRAPAPTLAPAAASASAATPPAPAAPVEEAAPSFDAVRVAPDGRGLVAGRAAPGTTVEVIAGGEVAAEAKADASGRFVAFLDLPPSAEPRELTLRGDAGASAGSVILSPTRGAPTPGAPIPGAPIPGAPASDAPDPAAGEAEVATAEAAPSPAEAPGTAGQGPVLLSDAEGVRVLQPAVAPDAGAEVLSNVAIDAIGYDGSGEVRLSGRGAMDGPGGDGAGGRVRLYLDNEPVAEAAIAPDGTWASSLDGTAPGVYTLRVDQIGPDGEVLSRIETPFQREERDALAAAVADAAEASGDAATPGRTVAVRTVQPGNTLWAIARDRYGEPMMYVQVFEMNRDRIRDPDLIYPGQVFVLPTVDGL
jgi:LysM repeat protein